MSAKWTIGFKWQGHFRLFGDCTFWWKGEQWPGGRENRGPDRNGLEAGVLRGREV